MNYPEFPVITSLSLGVLVDNLLPGATPFVDINHELAQYIYACRNRHLIVHLQATGEREHRLWKIDDWNSISEIARSKRAERDAYRANSMLMAEEFQKVKAHLSSVIGEQAGHIFSVKLFSAKSEQERKAITKVLNVDMSAVEHLFAGQSIPESYEVIITYKGKSVKLW
jgi:hypothetical protein